MYVRGFTYSQAVSTHIATGKRSHWSWTMEIILNPDLLREKAKELQHRAKKAADPRVKEALMGQARALAEQALAVSRDTLVE